MSLICDETGKDIEFGTFLTAGTRSDVEPYSALSGEVIDRIPLSERRLTPCVAEEGGVDVHEATSSRNYNGSYTILDFELGGFLFSISRSTAQFYLPKHYQRYPDSKS